MFPALGREGTNGREKGFDADELVLSPQQSCCLGNANTSMRLNATIPVDSFQTIDLRLSLTCPCANSSRTAMRTCWVGPASYSSFRVDPIMTSLSLSLLLAVHQAQTTLAS